MTRTALHEPFAPRRLSSSLALTAALALVACEDDSLSEIHPSVALCPAADAALPECDGTFELGDLPITLPASLPVFVKNTGRATLSVSGANASGPVEISTGPDQVLVGGSEPIDLVLTPTELGAGTATLEVVTDDPERPLATATLSFRGVEKPSSEIELCDVDGSGECGPNITVDFGTLRRGEERTRAVLVNNIGVVPLHVSEIRLEGETSSADEMALASSAQPGVIEPGGYLPVLLRYRPADAGSDVVTLVFLSDAEDNPEARATVPGASLANEPPLAQALEATSGLASAAVVVGEQAVLDGAASSDPEGDPLRYQWSLTDPDGSALELQPAGAVAVGFVPSEAGEYTASLVVEDSLGQVSAPASVTLTARPEHALRVSLEWSGGGDLDLHLVAAGAPFGAADCYFGQPQLALGDATSDVDDAFLLRDAEAAPGQEEAVIGVPADGLYSVYVHAFAGAFGTAGEATVSVSLDGATAPAFSGTQSLSEVCALWHVADVLFPEGDVVAGAAGVVQQCP